MVSDKKDAEMNIEYYMHVESTPKINYFLQACDYGFWQDHYVDPVCGVVNGFVFPLRGLIVWLKQLRVRL